MDFFFEDVIVARGEENFVWKSWRGRDDANRKRDSLLPRPQVERHNDHLVSML
jgi:hypothetical protein